MRISNSITQTSLLYVKHKKQETSASRGGGGRQTLEEREQEIYDRQKRKHRSELPKVVRSEIK